MSKRNKIKGDELAGIGDVFETTHQVIPIVSTDDDDMPIDIKIPSVIPILTLRSSVLFPGAITPITVASVN